MSTLHPFAALDNPNECNRSYASTAFPEFVEEMNAFIDSTYAEPTMAEEEAAYRRWLASEVQRDAEREAAARRTAKPFNFAKFLKSNERILTNRRMRRADARVGLLMRYGQSTERAEARFSQLRDSSRERWTKRLNSRYPQSAQLTA